VDVVRIPHALSQLRAEFAIFPPRSREEEFQCPGIFFFYSSSYGILPVWPPCYTIFRYPDFRPHAPSSLEQRPLLAKIRTTKDITGRHVATKRVPARSTTTRSVEAFLEKTAIAYHPNLRKSATFWWYAIAVFSKNASTLRVEGSSRKPNPCGKRRNHSNSNKLGKAKYQALAAGIFCKDRGHPYHPLVDGRGSGYPCKKYKM